MKKQIARPLSESHLQRIGVLGLRAVSYLHEAVACANGTTEWLPRDIIGADGKTLVVHRKADDVYTIDGWEPWHDGMFGGRYASIHNALAWVERAIDIRAGRASNFLGR